MSSLDEQTLYQVAQNGEMDYAKWPSIIDPLLERLNQIVHSEFPVPRPYPTVAQSDTQNQDTTTEARQSSSIQITHTPVTPRTLPPVPPFPGSSAADETATPSHVSNSQPDQVPSSSDSDLPRPELPVLLVQQLNTIISTLQSSFHRRPPHTIQRLSELTLEPTKHYKTLPAWLRAVDRVVSVSSTADIFPLNDTPAIVNGVNGDGAGGILWNNSNAGDTRNGGGGYESREKDVGLGSDESLGGALLTPIPWLRDMGIATGGTNDTDSINGDYEIAGAGTGTTAGITSDQMGVDDDLGEEIQTPDNISTPSSASDASTTDTPSTTDSPASHSLDRSSKVPQSTSTPTPISLTLSSDPLVPDRPLGAVTQGELIRMEQEAGVIPVTHSSSSSSTVSSSLPIPRTSGRSEHSPSIGLGVGMGLEHAATRGNDEADELLDQEREGVHARGPDLVGTVDMGLVGGKGIEVSIGSPPTNTSISTESNPTVDVNNAQDVLSGGRSLGHEFQTRQKQPEQLNDDSSTDATSNPSVLASQPPTKQTDEDEMQIDSSNEEISPAINTPTSADEDIVLVDADGATEDQRAKIDASNLNVGSETADGTGL